MGKNSHELSATKDRWFLEMNKQDEFLLEEFQPGHKVVVCAKCRRVWLLESWELHDCCPGGGCRHKETMPFGKAALRLDTSQVSRIRIKRNTDSGYNRTDRRIAEAMEGVHRVINGGTHWIGRPLARVLPYCACGLTGAALALSVLQFRVEESEINGRSGRYYQEAIIERKEKMIDSFEMTCEAGVDSLAETIEGSVETAGKIKNSLHDTVMSTITDTADVWTTTREASEDAARRAWESAGAAVDRTITTIKAEYGIGG